MAIKMRVNNKESAVCEECGATSAKSLNMFDICMCGEIHTICDLCNEKLFSKSLSASCYINGRLKNDRDMRIISQRRNSIGFKSHMSINEAMKDEK